MSSLKFSHVLNNRLLSALPNAVYEPLLAHLQRAHLARGKVLYNTGDVVRYAYFPLNGMISLLSLNKDGDSIELGMVGNEGLVGIPSILRNNTSPYRVVVQLPSDVMMIRSEVLKREFNRSAQLQDLLLRFLHVLLVQISQSAVCNHFHRTEARLSRWLLISRDRAKSNTLYLTQEFLAQMLGTPRTGVTLAAGALQEIRLINYSRGKITILDPEGLEMRACECYKIITEEIEDLLAA
jgi:CRP-like cAMP-binding protein